jgi:hypothetical protein
MLLTLVCRPTRPPGDGEAPRLTGHNGRARKAIGGVTTGMILRRVGALGILLSAFLGLGVLSFLGNRILSGIFGNCNPRYREWEVAPQRLGR